jgi:hypothetical protein
MRAARFAAMRRTLTDGVAGIAPVSVAAERGRKGEEAASWLGQRDRLNVLADHIKRVSRRMFAVPEFFFYAIADGVGRMLARHGRWHGLDGPDEAEETCQMELALSF